MPIALPSQGLPWQTRLADSLATRRNPRSSLISNRSWYFCTLVRLVAVPQVEDQTRTPGGLGREPENRDGSAGAHGSSGLRGDYGFPAPATRPVLHFNRRSR
ncbi:hypothetical protein PYH37_006338 (plasmid) [Sinorhizobium numidicum]|uniref:Uncharacterized protein n=1 Tax=Sinorhizobium numidicum TaxID=680248 RepID=A0ABY8D416_9HYPH|nr:hypothetical protein [Sinorhizobium numidicum]WEX79430.1 hypothetical protein PYH37_006338 [Sinorhizobium numidicum]WEX85614.1 hypothetical protein PYH38_006046 [Sinorhizobium numidicum]